MKVAGGILVVFACIMVIGGLQHAMTAGLASTHDLSVFLGGLTLALGVLTVGIVLIRKAKTRQPRH